MCGALLELSSQARPGRNESEAGRIVIGDPDPSQDRRWNFPPLAGARSEAVAVAALVGEQPLLGQEATMAHVLDRLKANRNTSLIYFATPALSDPVNPMDGSFLALARYSKAGPLASCAPGITSVRPRSS